MKIKNTIYVVIVTVLLASCGWSEKNHTVSKPYSLVNDDTIVAVKWDTGYRKVPGHKDATTGKWVPMQYVKDSLQPSEFKRVPHLYVDVNPSRESVWKAANQDGWSWQWKLGVFFLVAAVVMLLIVAGLRFSKSSKKLEFDPGSNVYDSQSTAKTLIRGVAGLVILGLLFITTNPVNKSGNNTKRIRKEQYDKIIKTDPNLIQFFDSIQKNNKFVR